MNLQPLLDVLELQEDAARALTDDLCAQIDELRPGCGRPRPTSNTS
ncbi:hypothetical protein ACIRIU_19620 [Streptomyces sp. NPDC102351]